MKVKRTSYLLLPLLLLLNSCGSGVCQLSGCLWKEPFGVLDNSFGVSGRTTFEFTTETSKALGSIYPQNDGKILGCGSEGSNATQNHLIFRLHSNGSLDNSFSNDGYEFFSFSGAFRESCLNVFTDSTNRILYSGYYGLGFGNDSFTVGRLLSDGTIDTTFNSGGTNTLNFTGLDDYPYATVETAAEDYILGGIAGLNFAWGRFYNNGSLDTTFGTAGSLVVDLAGSSFEQVLVIKRNANTYYNIGRVAFATNDISVFRTDQNMTLDTTYGTAGYFTKDSGASDNAYDGILENDHTLLITGSLGTNCFITKLTATGIEDPTFPNGGTITITPPSSTSCTGYKLLKQINNKIILVGTTAIGGLSHIFMTRYTQAGILDTTFGSNGIVIAKFNNSITTATEAFLQPDGKIVVSGMYANPVSGRTEFMFARYR